MPGDRAKSRERKLKKIQEQWSGQQQWIYKKCELCGESFVVNNYEDRRPRTPRIFKRICCPWCAGRRGKLRMAEHILVERLAVHGCESEVAMPMCKCLPCIARRLTEKANAKDNLAG